jgi:hypothetical protein
MKIRKTQKEKKAKRERDKGSLGIPKQTFLSIRMTKIRMRLTEG